MSDRQEVESRQIIDGRPVLVKLVHNPTVDDVVITEARIHASYLENANIDVASRRVQRDIRDFLIRLGVER